MRVAGDRAERLEILLRDEVLRGTLPRPERLRHHLNRLRLGLSDAEARFRLPLRREDRGLLRPFGASQRMYGPLPHAGYYGAGAGPRPFKKGQAGFSNELSWYRLQYGEKTSGYEKRKK